ncbi:MAG: hypothetical protein Q9174_005768 [Haloplaca sp. 1 TL-2023]
MAKVCTQNRFHKRWVLNVLNSVLHRTVRACLYTALVYYALDRTLDSLEEVEEVSKDQKTKRKNADDDNTGSEEADEEEDEEGSVFIPLGLAYELPRQYYKGSDPEWQSFIKLASDKQRCNYLKNELTGLVGRYAGSHPMVQKVTGKNNKPKQFWIYMDFPDGPPPEYERKGFATPTLARRTKSS